MFAIHKRHTKIFLLSSYDVQLVHTKRCGNFLNTPLFITTGVASPWTKFVAAIAGLLFSLVPACSSDRVRYPAAAVNGRTGGQSVWVVNCQAVIVSGSGSATTYRRQTVAEDAEHNDISSLVQLAAC